SAITNCARRTSDRIPSVIPLSFWDLISEAHALKPTVDLDCSFDALAVGQLQRFGKRHADEATPVRPAVRAE
ncbi:MAG: hypothetical protein ACLP6W_22890, partial [Bryobacteraceae bacterium]